MFKTVGIPEGLYYYKYMVLWKAFFQALGVTVVTSGQTNRTILDNGVRTCVDEACLPVKVFFGHVQALCGKVDCIFIPRLTSISAGEYICPQIGGLPDTVKNSLKDIPPLISTEVNLRLSKTGAWKAAVETGNYFTSDVQAIKYAYEIALDSYRRHRKMQLSGEIRPEKSFSYNITGMLQKHDLNSNSPAKTLSIAVIGHPYIIYDSYLNMDLLRKLFFKGIKVITYEMVTEDDINKHAACLKKPIFWNHGRKALGSALYLDEISHFKNAFNIDGIIYISSFGCGIDSFVFDLMKKLLSRKSDIPVMLLTLDEHSGEAGMDTRLEAFIDMLEWRDHHNSNISASG